MHGLDRPITRQLPPKAQRIPTFSVQHGVELVDEYAWLRADNWQEVMRDPAALDPQIRAYLEAENAYTEGALADTAALQKALYAEMRARIKEDDSSVPAPDGAFEYFASYVTGGQYPRLCRQRRGGGGEEVLLDGNKEAEGKQLLADRCHGPQPRPQAHGLCGRREGIGAFHDPHPRPGNRPGSARRHPGHTQRHRLGARQPDAVLRAPRCQPAPAVRLPPPRRHARPRTTCSSTRRRTSASTSASARRSRASSSPSMRTTTRRPRST